MTPQGMRAQETYRLSELHIESHNVVRGAVLVACLIASEFKQAPSVAQLREHFGMSRATAYRWRRAWRTALEMRQARGEQP